MKIYKKDIRSGIKLTISAKKSEPACMQCLPPVPMRDHPNLNGKLIHSRIDCPNGLLYVVNEKEFKLK